MGNKLLEVMNIKRDKDDNINIDSYVDNMFKEPMNLVNDINKLWSNKEDFRDASNYIFVFEKLKNNFKNLEVNDKLSIVDQYKIWLAWRRICKENRRNEDHHHYTNNRRNKKNELQIKIDGEENIKQSDN